MECFRDPRLGCIECFGSARLWKKGQDKTDETEHITSRTTAEIPASDAWNASDEQDYGQQDKARGTKHVSAGQRSPPRMHRMLQRFAPRMHGMPPNVSGIVRQWKSRQDTTVQDNDPRFGCIECFGQFTRATFSGNLQVKCRGSKWWIALCASLRSRNALGYFTRAILCEKYG